MTDNLKRVLPLEGGCNFRDLGGYQTTDGRRIRPGVLFRSGVMSYFTPDDHPHLTRLGIRTICDLRRAAERKKEPTRWPTDARMVSWDEEQRIEVQSELLLADIVSGDHARKVMISLYRAMPGWLQARLRGIFGHLAGGDVPLLFHCAAGKDRTGLSAALVLHTLGVPRETILDDYELTNRAVNLQAFLLKHHRTALGLTDGVHPLQTIAPDVLDAVLNADRAYLSAALEQIEADHDSIDNYVREVLRVSDSMKRAIRNALLTS